MKQNEAGRNLSKEKSQQVASGKMLTFLFNENPQFDRGFQKALALSGKKVPPFVRIKKVRQPIQRQKEVSKWIRIV